MAGAQAEGERARTSQAVAERAAVDAEKRAVAAEAHLASERAAKAALDTHVAELQDSLKRVEGDGARAAAAQASADGLREHVTLLTQTVSMLRSLLEAAGKPVPHMPTEVAGESTAEGTKAKPKAK